MESGKEVLSDDPCGRNVWERKTWEEVMKSDLMMWDLTKETEE